MSSKGMREGSKHESAVDGREVGRSEGAKQPSQDTKKLLFKTDEGRNGAASIIFIYVEISKSNFLLLIIKVNFLNIYTSQIMLFRL